MARRLTPRLLAICAASGVLCALLVYAGHSNLLIALAGGISTAALVAIAILAGEGGRKPPVRIDSGEHMSRRITPSSVDVIPSDLRIGEQRSIESVQRARQDTAVRAFLRLMRDATKYEEIVFWRSEIVGGTQLSPIAWSSDFTDPPEWKPAERAIIDWANESRLTVTDGREPPELVAGPVGTGTLLRGVLSFSRPASTTIGSTEAKKWLDRLANHLALLVDLLETRNEFQRQSRHSQALLRAAYKIQANSSNELIGPAICETALEVTSATRAALIHWNADEMEGRVESVSAGHPVPVGFAVVEESLVGQMCTTARPLVKEDLPRGSVGHVYGGAEPARELSSLGVFPLKTQDEDVIGAIVIEGELPGDVNNAEMRNIGLLATVASQGLQLAWKMEETSRRARTDQLTGLFNRRHFDEQLERVLNESDRYGRITSLVIADLDFFKRVNDTHGHDAGDAVLRHTASLFMEIIRAVDTCARYGGEEFAILLPETDSGGAMLLAERLRLALESRPVRFGRVEIRATASFGVATYPDSAPLRDGLFPAADKALYRAKADGRNCVRQAPVNAGRRAT